MKNGTCPNCGSNVPVSGNAHLGDILMCETCDTEVEVVSVNPVELDWPLEGMDEYGDFSGFDGDLDLFGGQGEEDFDDLEEVEDEDDDYDD